MPVYKYGGIQMNRTKQILIKLTEPENDEIEFVLNKINFNKEYKYITNKSVFIRQLIKLGLENFKLG